MNGTGLTFVDTSSIGQTATSFGSATQSSGGKWGGNRGVFDGSTAYLSVASNAALALGTSNFTIDFWATRSGEGEGAAFPQIILDARTAEPSSQITIRVNTVSTGRQISLWVDGVSRIVGTAMAINTRYYVAITRSAGVTRLFVNGLQVGGDWSDTTNYTATTWTVGRGSVAVNGSLGFFQGSINDLRLVRGTAAYTATFTAPTTAIPAAGGGGGGATTDPNFSSVSLLLHMDGSNNSTTFTDSGPNAFTIAAAGSAKLITGNKKFGTAALSLDGNSSYLSVAANSAFDMGTGNWTIELWTYTTDQTKAYPALIANNGSWGTNATSLRFETLGSSQKFTLNYNTSTSGGAVLLETGTYSFNQWRHVAAVREGTTLRIYVDGAQAASMTIASTVAFNWSAGGYVYVGNSWDGASSNMTETIDDVRITKGVARYTANFTPPTAAFPDS
jgi:hypothetical protein